MLIDCSKNPTTETTVTESTLSSVTGGEEAGKFSAKGGRGGEKGGKKDKTSPEPEPEQEEPGVWNLYDGLNGVYNVGCVGGYTAVSADFFMKLGWASQSDYTYTEAAGDCRYDEMTKQSDYQVSSYELLRFNPNDVMSRLA